MLLAAHSVSCKSAVWCNATPGIVYVTHHKYSILSWDLSLRRCLVVGHDEGLAILCLLTNQIQNMNQNYPILQGEPRNSRKSSVYIPSSRLHFVSLFLIYLTHCQHLELSQHHLTCTQCRLPFQYTPDNQHNFVHSLWDSFHYIQLYHNANALEVDPFSTHSDGTSGRRQTEGNGNCLCRNAHIDYKSIAGIPSGSFNGIHLGTNPCTPPDIHCLRPQWCKGMERHFQYNLS